MGLLRVLVASERELILRFSRYPKLRGQSIRRVAHDFISGKILDGRRFGREILQLQAL